MKEVLLEKRYAGLDRCDDHIFVRFRSAMTVRLEVRENKDVVSWEFVIWMLMVGLFVTQWKAYEKWTHQVGFLESPPYLFTTVEN